MFEDQSLVAYGMAIKAPKEDLKRLLAWYLKGKPEEERVMQEAGDSKQEILNALVRNGAIG